mgnify:CR=1 FL=1
MLFSSLPFLFYFLPCTLGLYFLVPRRLKNAALLLCSLVFYAWGEPRFVLFMAAAILQGYAAARLMERYPTRRRLLLTLSAVLSLGMLAYCKYADFLISGFNAVTGLSVPLLRMALPIGISFYTFQILSYVIDVYRGDAPAQRNLIDLAAYIAPSWWRAPSSATPTWPPSCKAAPTRCRTRLWGPAALCWAWGKRYCLPTSCMSW